jgi:hypothetical protein
MFRYCSKVFLNPCGVLSLTATKEVPMNYFTKLTADVLAYYRKYSTKDVSREQFNKTAFLADYGDNTLTDEQALEVLNQLDYSSRKKLYKEVLDGVDFFDPDERMLDLLDLMDPNKTYFQEDT